jgi:hypothetical protein
MRRLAVRREGQAKRLRVDLLHHLWTRFPNHCVTMGAAQANTCVEAIITRAEAHEFDSLDTLTSYANLMVFLGAEFDEDPQLAWAGEHLRKTRQLPRPVAIGELLSLTATQLATLIGPSGEYYRRALLWARSKSFETLTETYCHDADRGLRVWLHDLHPSKYDDLGREGVTRVIEDARLGVAPHGLGSREGVMIYAGSMVLLGSGFERDPFHPWAKQALTRAAAAAVQDPIEGARLLHAAAMQEFERFLSLDRIIRKS